MAPGFADLICPKCGKLDLLAYGGDEPPADPSHHRCLNCGTGLVYPDANKGSDV